MLIGYKTKLGAIGLVLTGLARIVNSLSDGFNWPEISEGLGLVAAGIAAFGIGDKIDRQ